MVEGDEVGRTGMQKRLNAKRVRMEQRERNGEEPERGEKTRRKRWKGARTEEELPDDTSDIRSGLDKAFKVGRKVLASVESILQHRRDGVDNKEVVGYRHHA